MEKFEYGIGNEVYVGIGGMAHGGVVVGRAEYRDSPVSYYVAYHDSTGNYVKDWFFGAELVSAVED